MANEVFLMRSADHPNILKVHEVHETNSCIYLIIDIVDGGDLSNYLIKNKVNSKQIKEIMKQILSGLAHLESKQIIHRDIKTLNIMVKNPPLDSNEFPTLLICDFGLACKNIEPILCKGSGTYGYMAPEVMESKSKEEIPYSTKIDVFSVGVIFYKL